MLKNIPKTFVPDLVKLMMQMGHGETLLICDANFPYLSMGKDVLHIPASSIAPLLKDILHFFPLDKSVDSAALVMESSKESGRFEEYQHILSNEGNSTKLESVERFEFYESARKAVGAVITGDTTKGGNIIIQKGVVTDDDI